SRQNEEQDHPVFSQFLTFLENDMKKNPQKFAPVPTMFWQSMKALTVGVNVDLEAPLIED
ncbi:type II toxin-antitoxin system PrlF family antitoxin, partial [Escherichia coli]|uniref:type II toxin-antitoxin system PrlF family antitoxin n=1 Tax=Escherichia coli TaxID=562 RepID=UPI002FEFE67B